jgi:hypothetical protein
VPSCAASKRADYRPTRSFAQRRKIGTHSPFAALRSDLVCFLRVFRPVGKVVGRRTLDPIQNSMTLSAAYAASHVGSQHGKIRVGSIAI